MVVREKKKSIKRQSYFAQNIFLSIAKNASLFKKKKKEEDQQFDRKMTRKTKGNFQKR